MRTKKRAQTAMEFIFMFSFMFVLFIGMMGALSSRLNEVKTENELTHLKSVQDQILQEIKLAKIVGDGYLRVFKLPEVIGSEEYEIKLENNNTLIITMNEKEYIKILPFNVSGVINKGDNNIIKHTNSISLNPEIFETSVEDPEEFPDGGPEPFPESDPFAEGDAEPLPEEDPDALPEDPEDPFNPFI